MTTRILALALLVPVVFVPLVGCGAGVAGVAAGSGSSGGGAAPTITAFEVPNPKVSPAALRIEASESVLAELFFARPGAGEAPMTALAGPGVSGHQVRLAAGMNDLAWNFALQLHGPDFVPGVDLVVRHPNGTPITGGSLHLEMGNDPPEVQLVDPMPTDPADPSESSGNVEVRLGVSDSSSDVVAIHVEWRRASDAPDAWQPATAAGVFPGGVETDPAGVTLSFFWNTNVDLADGDLDVLLRATADDGTLDASGDPIGVSQPLVSALLHIDNNEEPIVQLLNDAVLANPDERRGIPVPVRVIDEEGDLVQLVLQWRREGEEFPALPSDEAALDALLADPAQRREAHVCTEFPQFAHGRAVPIDASSIRLPELATSEAWALANGLEGQRLELLRPSSIPAPITPGWSANPLAGPVAALPVGDGLCALVLDAPGGSWRLRKIELATGAVLPDAGSILASGPGAPSAMALERGERAVLVASDLAGAWRIERLELASGVLTQLVLSDGGEPGPVHGIASRGTSTALFTVGASLFQVDYRDPLAPRLAPLLAGLAAPSGVAFDPLDSNRCYVSERNANRVLAFELDSHARSRVVVRNAGGAPIELVEPTALAFDGKGPRLFVVTAAPGGGQQLTGIDLGAQGGNVAFALGEPRVGGIGAVACGQDGLRLAAVPGDDELLVAGGVEQRRTIRALDPQSPAEPREHRVVVEPPFDRMPAPSQPWRIPLGSRVHSSVDGVVARFVWDSADAHTGSVFLRALGRDAERGPVAEAAATKRVRHGLEVEPQPLGESFQGSWVAIGDLDGDGDEDIAALDQNGSNGGSLNVFFQNQPGDFHSPPLVLGGLLGLTQVGFAALGDLDGDEDLDVAVTHYSGDNAVILYQETPGSFGPPQPLPGQAVTLAIGDLDGDGDQDILGTSELGTAIFFQEAKGVFGAPQVIGDPARPFGRSLAVGDLDGDGDLDALARLTAGPTIFFQEAPGSFGPPQLIGDLALGFGAPLAIGDLDGDGDQDVLAQSGTDLAVFIQQAPGSYSVPVVLEDVTGGSGDLVIQDLDGDGDQDFVAGRAAFFQDAPGVFPDEPAVILQAGFVSSLAHGDLDGDGACDLVGSDIGHPFVLFQAGPGRFRAPENPTQTSSSDVAIGDTDGDGDQDLVFADVFGSPPPIPDIAIFPQGSPRSFDAPPLVLEIPGVASGYRPVAFADLDSDGDQDVVGENLAVLFQTAPGMFSEPIVLGSPGQGELFAIGDLDCDGDQDIASRNSLGVTVFFQEAPGSWTPLVLEVPGGVAFSIAIHDLDGDGHQDILAGTELPGLPLAVFFQECPAGFGAAPLLLAVFPLAIGDMDGDGDPDIVWSGADHTIRVTFQGPVRGFDAPPFVMGGLPVTFQVRDVAVGDLDADGDQDIIAVQQGGLSPAGLAAPGLVAFFQGSPGAFGPGRQLVDAGTTSGTFFYVETTDLDGDGELDIVGGASLDTILWGGR